MNLRSRWKNGKMPSSGSSGASLTTPVIISGATSPAARAIARIRPVRMPGAAAGSTTREDRLELGGAQGERAFAHGARASPPGPLRWPRSPPARSAAPASATPRGCRRCRRWASGSASGKKRRSMRAADAVDEEAEAEDAEDDRGHAGQVVDGDAHRAHQQPLPGRTRAGRSPPARRAAPPPGSSGTPSSRCRRWRGRRRPRCSTRGARPPANSQSRARVDPDACRSQDSSFAG